MTKEVKINRKLAKKVLKTVDAGLCSGMGEPEPGKMCVEAAVCYAMGLPHGDRPICVSPALRKLKVVLNDASWSSNQERARGLRRLALAQLGSAGTLDDVEFVKRVSNLAIQKVVSVALRAAAEIHPDKGHKKALKRAASACEGYGTESAARSAASAAERADSAVLSDFAESVVQVLIEMKAPGCEFLDLAPQIGREK